jgi:endonuclease/exonuclease/phosphatase (EEP) superfamily protein YafD
VIVTADRPEDCAQTLTAAQHADDIAGLGTTFALLNWNVEKAKDPALLGEFAELAKRSDLIFLQEAVPLKKAQTLIEESLYDAFVRGYIQNEIETGVLTLARTPHIVHCQLLATEPWLRTPKATSVTLYPLENSDGTLHSAESAANHLELKYSRGKRYADSAEAFIERLASRSSWTGEPYRMICEGSAMPAANWLTKKLDAMKTGLWQPEHNAPGDLSLPQ